MTREDPELLANVRDFTTLFYVIFRRKSSEWSESSIKSDFGMRFAIWSVEPFAILGRWNSKLHTTPLPSHFSSVNSITSDKL